MIDTSYENEIEIFKTFFDKYIDYDDDDEFRNKRDS